MLSIPRLRLGMTFPVKFFVTLRFAERFIASLVMTKTTRDDRMTKECGSPLGMTGFRIPRKPRNDKK